MRGKVDLKTNALNNAHISLLLHYYMYTLRSKNKLVASGFKSQNTTCKSVLSGCTFGCINKIIQNRTFPSALSNISFTLIVNLAVSSRKQKACRKYKSASA
jgi:hypothetical protein